MKKMLVLMLLAWNFAALPAWAEKQSDQTKRAQIHTELGAGYFGMGKLGVALDELNTAIRADSKYAPAYNILGLIYMELREFDKADESFKRSLSIDASNSDTHNNYGWFLCQRNRVDEAIGHFMNALKNPLYTTPEKAYLNAGQCSLKKGDDQGAEDYFLRAIKFQPAPPQAMYYLSDIQFRRAKYNNAQFYLEQFMKSGPTPEGLWLGARIAHRTNNRDAEANYGLQLRKRFPDSREAIAYRNRQFDNADAAEVRQ
ncbi:MAG: type IV pilus biogenesis/stability protein PilW [Pseudomonadota bacterium]|nr:type IV pilus biogenesis/stability protein PilW [Gammaproteobacteria bacterium]MBU1732312.1 type IV pilus biogenesis/stability protein PilW [Gammaproteobacteria bacterium]MBU1893882.1 type IV pilus biogenesis/stability protein PilW [Gammaproteobacteria bacterium]